MTSISLSCTINNLLLCLLIRRAHASDGIDRPCFDRIVPSFVVPAIRCSDAQVAALELLVRAGGFGMGRGGLEVSMRAVFATRESERCGAVGGDRRRGGTRARLSRGRRLHRRIHHASTKVP